jgi:hypothetical protein
MCVILKNINERIRIMYDSFEDHRGDEKIFSAMREVWEASSILEVSSWSGFRGGHKDGIIVTKYKTIYAYERLGLLPIGADSSDHTFIKKKRELTEEEYNKITEFIKKNLIDKEYDDEKSYDGGCNITVDYDGIHKEIKCGFASGQGNIYNVTKKFVERLAEPTIRNN